MLQVPVITFRFHTTYMTSSHISTDFLLNTVTYLRLDRISDATSAQRGTIPLRILLTTNATAHAAISLSSTKSLSSSDCGPANNQLYSNSAGTFILLKQTMSTIIM